MTSEFEGIPDDDVWNIDFADLIFEKQIARGSFGKVYKGTFLGIPVAIKSILRHDDPAYIKYVEREISILKGIRHPYIVGFCGVSTDGHGLFIVTEFINGGDVRSHIKADRLTWPHRIQICSDLAKAIYYLHSKKIIHRDLKSKNLLMGPDNRVRLCDFGFARTTDILGQRSMTICGTPGFVAPEVMMGWEYDGQCDVFSFGNVLAELITLKRPGKDFWSRNVSDEFQMDTESLEPLAPRDCPPELVSLAIACCAYNPADRPLFSDIIKQLRTLEVAYPMEIESVGTPKITSPTLGTHPRSKTLAENISDKRVNLTESEHVITHRHLVKMIARATSPDVIDLEYVNDFLMTYPCFAKPTTVMENLIKRLNSVVVLSAEDSIGEPAEVSKKQRLSLMRVIIFMKEWIDKYVEDFDGEEMSNLAGIFQSVIPPPESERYNIDNMVTKNRSKRTTRESTKTIHGGKPFDLSQLLATSTLQIAQQIAIILHTSYKSMSPREFLKDNWKQRTEGSLPTFMHDAKKMSLVIASCIVRGENKEQRTNLLAKFIDVANQCLLMRNFQGFFSLMQGIHHPGVERLTSAFQGLKMPVQHLLKTFKPIFSKENHYEVYKQKQATCMPPTIPFLEPYLDELSYIDTYYPDVAQGGVIHFAKHRKLGRVIRSVLSYQDSAYENLGAAPSISVLLLQTPTSEDDINRFSFQAEAPSSFQ